ncbi:SprB repeat-containing protein [Chitinophaga flava]|uniref:Secretion system C-terminal sorting domain-containing protein n=1 Tax=Chitinophaga flava TaxID=2259036 RepID=A0A365XSU9_9BACT|nr:SprB repeat-containing protein [Chitinophaga flava]RBL89432.1 hypothetical protein DF182_23220 [Chitinophaga flava]
MKIYIGIILTMLLWYQQTSGQANYRLKTKTSIYRPDFSYRYICDDNFFDLVANFSNARGMSIPTPGYQASIGNSGYDMQNLVSDPNWSAQYVPPTPQRVLFDSITFPTTNDLTGIYIRTLSSKSGGGGCSVSCDESYTFPVSGLSSAGCAYTSRYKHSNYINDNTCFTHLVEVWVYPILDNALQQPADKAIGTEDPITISAIAGFPSPVYKWQFNVDGTWRSFPAAYIGSSTIAFTATDLLAGSGLNVNNYISKNVYIRLDNCSGGSSSNIITLNIKKSPPAIINTIVTQPTCFDSNDGKFNVTFGRSLLNGESLLLNLLDPTRPGRPLFHQITAADLGADNSYTFPDNLPAANYYLTYQSKFDTAQSNVKKTVQYSVTAPAPVAFTTTSSNVWCYAGKDGTITLQATGGVGNYQYMIKRAGQPDSSWYSFSSGNTSLITALSAGNYIIQVRDGSQCYAKSSANGPVINKNIAITQPAVPLQINLVQSANPLGYGLSDGWVEAEITGGTGLPDGSYHYQWTSNGTVLTGGVTTTVTATGYRIRLSGIPQGTYKLNVTDNNYLSATTNAGCTATDSFSLVQPPPLVVAIAITDSVQCKGNTDGILVAHAKGGMPFTTGLPYAYTWKKKNTSGTWDVLTTQTDSIAGSLNAGWYAVNIKDANGIVLNKDSIFFLPEPLLLQVSISKTDVTCSGFPDGNAFANVTGGNQPYQLIWNTGDTGDTITHLAAGTYLVYVKDRHGCKTQLNTVIAQPNAINVTATVTQPTCFNSCDGAIAVGITGGTSPFIYQWTGTNGNASTVNNLCSGAYQVKITDANGCSFTQGVTLDNPAPLPLRLKPDRYICTGQAISYDITVDKPGMQYQWTSPNGFSSRQAAVTLTQAGTYYAQVVDAHNCISKDTLVLTAFTSTVASEFALPSQAFTNEDIVIVNISNPAPDSIRWTLPAAAGILQQDYNLARLTFRDTGTYAIRLTTYKGSCYADQVQQVIVTDRAGFPGVSNTRNPFIKEFSISPNPNYGSFTVQVVLQRDAPIRLKLIRLNTSQVTSLVLQSGLAAYSIPMKVTAASGLYVLVLETPNGNASLKVAIL